MPEDEWAFDDAPNTATFLSTRVHDGEEAITYVSHDVDDGAWQFLGDRLSDGGGPVLVGLSCPVGRDPSVRELADLPFGWSAKRVRPGAPWTRYVTPEE